MAKYILVTNDYTRTFEQFFVNLEHISHAFRPPIEPEETPTILTIVMTNGVEINVTKEDEAKKFLEVFDPQPQFVEVV